MSTTSEQLAALRLKLLENAYSPIQNLDKRTFLKGWPTVEITPELIHQWSRASRFKGTGLRIENGLAVIDIDVNADAEKVDAIAEAIESVVPGLGASALVRYGKGNKEAWFVRTEEKFSRIHTRRWLPPGASDDAETYCVECFGGLSPRQFGSFGPHTVSDAGEVLVSYEWAGDASPATVPLDDLPVVGKRQFHAIVDAIETVFASFGWEAVKRSTKGEGDAARVYDLTDDMFFDLHDGRRVSLPELREIAASEEGLRCSASWLEGPQAKRTDRCIIGTTGSGTLTVWESASGETHLPLDANPKPYKLDLDRFAEKLREIDDRRKFRVSSEDDAAQTAAKLLRTHAFCARQNMVVPVWTDDILDGLTMPAFRTLMLPNCTEDVGPRGGRVVINPVDIWSKDHRRINVAGIRMRPDKPRPTYEEGGQVWINAYRPPDLPEEGGTVDPVLAFLASLLPDEAERRWFIQWLAYKLHRPDIPGPAVVMVAREFGTGRGTLGEIIKRLFGRAYVTTLPFAIFAGRSSQAQYTDWGAGSLMVLVNESSESDGGGRYTVKKDTYEHLKEIVEPRPIERAYIAKGRQQFKAMSHTSYIIFTNNGDALPIPENDRRFAVLTNGDPILDTAYWDDLNAWIDSEENIGAFARWLLDEVDLTGYSPYARPLATIGKRDMTEAAKSDLDRGIDIALASLQSPVWVPDQMLRLLRVTQREYGLAYPDKWQEIARRQVAGKGHRVGVKDGRNWVLYHEGRKHPVYATSQRGAAQATALPPPDLKREVFKNGNPVDTGDNIAGLFKR